VKASISYTLGSFIENLVLTGTAVSGTGNALDNILTGNSAANVLDGGAGADTMTGGAGNDIYYVDNSGDAIGESTGGGTDLVYAGVSYNLGGQAIENLTLTGTGNTNAAGNSLNNVLVGNTGRNTLNGGAGHDTLTGGLGADIFYFGLGSADDTVKDFSGAQGDVVNVHAYSNGVVNGGGIVISQSGANTVIDMGGGNVVTLTGIAPADLNGHIVW